jgi:hypothetical protein
MSVQTSTSSPTSKIKTNIKETVDQYRQQELDNWPTDKLLRIYSADKKRCPESLCDPESKNDCTIYTYIGTPDILATVEPLEDVSVSVQKCTIRWGRIYRTVVKEHPSYGFARTISYKEDSEYQPSPGELPWRPTYYPRLREYVGFTGDYYHGYVLSTYDRGICVGGVPVEDRPFTVVPHPVDGTHQKIRAVLGPGKSTSYDVVLSPCSRVTSYFRQFAKYPEVKTTCLRSTSKTWPYKGPVGNWQKLSRRILIRIIESSTAQYQTNVHTPVKRTLVEVLEQRHGKLRKTNPVKVQSSTESTVAYGNPVQVKQDNDRKPPAREL